MKGIRGVVIACAGATVLLAGACKGSDHAKDGDGAITPPASATFGSSGSSTTAPSTTSPPTPSSVMLEPSSPPIPPTHDSTDEPTGQPSRSNDAASRFGTLVEQWQTAQSTFLRRATGGSDSIAAEHHWAATFLTAERRFAAALDPARWPARATGSLRALRTASNAEQRKLQAMTTAAGPSAFTSLLGAYSGDVTAENRAIRTVRQALA